MTHHFSLADAIRAQQSGNAALAEKIFRGHCMRTPNDAEAHHCFGMLLLQLGRPEDALHSLKQAVQIAPKNAVYRNNLGLAYPALDRLDLAIDCFRKAITLDPTLAAAHNSLGNALRLTGKHQDAAESCRTALKLAPNFAEAHSNLGNALLALDRPAEAHACYERALEINPNYVRARNNLGSALRYLFRLDESVAQVRQAIAQAPTFVEAHKNLAGILLVGGDTETAISHLRLAIAADPNQTELRTTLLFSLQYSNAIDEQALLAEYQEFFKFRAKFENQFRETWSRHKNIRDFNRKIRVGYVSADFREHAVSFFIEPILQYHDKSSFEIFCYSNSIKNDAWTKRLSAHASSWIDVSALSDGEMAQRIEADHIDILVDLSGHTSGNRLDVFARKPAPIQMTWIGTAGTTGLTSIDYRISDALLDPPGMTEAFHTEKIIRLNKGGVFIPHPLSPEINRLPALRQGYVTFCSLNTPRKLNPTIIGIWGQLMRALPTAKLILAATPLLEFQRKLEVWFSQAGITANRIQWQPPVQTTEFLKLHQNIDVALDTFPYNGGTTSSHALWMGVPVVTLAGTRTVSRVGATVLSGAGLDDLVTHNTQEFVQRAVELASDLESLDNLRQTMRDRIIGRESSSPKGVTLDLETHYRSALKIWCASG